MNNIPSHSITELSEDHEHIDIYISPELLRETCLSVFDAEFYDFLMSDGTTKHIDLANDEFFDIVNRAKDLELAYKLAANAEVAGSCKICVHALAVQLLGALYRNRHIEQKQCPDWLGAFLKKIQHPDMFSLPVEELIKMSNYSHTFFSVTFKKCFDKSFKSYIDELRINYAISMLRSTEMSVLEISLAVGYDSISHFVQKFKNYTGKTPLVYRKSQ